MNARARMPWSAIAVLLTTAVALCSPIGARAADPVSSQAEATFAEIAGCLASSDEMRVIMVVDESRSLDQTDPDAERTDGLLAALDSLAVLQQAYPDKQINVAAATFAADYTPRIGWGQAAGEHLAAMRSFATDDVPNLDDGTSTDYRAAIKGAQRDLASAGPPACKVMLWFTDGGLDVADSDSATAGALNEICTPGGIADAARSEGVHIIAAALFREDSDLVTDEDRATLAQVAEAQAAGGSCGTVPLPERFAGGAYVSANDPSQLSALFAQILARISGFTPAQTVECPGDDCVTGSYRFAIDPGIAWARLIAAPAAGSNPQYSLTEPGGTAAQLPLNDSVPLGAFTVETSQAGSTAQFDIDLTKGTGIGSWTFDVKDGAALVSLYLLPGLQVALDPADQQLAATSATDVGLLITDVTGQPVDPAVYGSFRVTGSVDGGSEQVARQEGRIWRLSVPPPPTGALPSSRQLTTSVDVVTTPSGQQIEPVVRQFTMPVSLSAYFPTLHTQELIMSPVAGDGSSSGSVAVTGSTEGASRACVGPVALVGPEEQGTVTAQPERDCVDLGPGASGELTLQTGQFAAVADGTLTGSTQVTLTSVRAEDPAITFEIPTRLSIARPVDEAVRWLLVLALLLASLAVPLLMIYLLGRRLARFDAADADWVRVLRVPVAVAVTGTEARLLREGRTLWLEADDVIAYSPDPPHRRTAWAGGGLRLATRFRVFGRARLGRRLQVPTLSLDPSAETVSVDAGTVLVSDQAPYAIAEPPSAPCNLRIERTWYLEFDADVLRDLLEQGDGDLPESGSAAATLVIVRLDSVPGTYAEQGEQLAAETVKPLHMLRAAAEQARNRAPLQPQPVSSGVAASTGQAGGAGPHWLTGTTGPGAAGGAATGGSGSGREGPPSGSTAPPGDREGPDDGIPEWLR